MRRLLDQFRSLSDARRRYVLGAAGGGGSLVSLAVTLWAAGAFAGGEENPQVACSPCPTVGRTPGPTSTVSSTPTPPCCPPTLAPTLAPPSAPTEPPPPPPAPTEPTP